MDSGESERRSLRAHLDTLWKAAEAERHTSVPREARGFLEEYLGLPEPTMYPDEDDIRAVMDEFIEKGLPALNRYVAQKMAARGSPRTAGKSGPQASTRPWIYAKPLAKRLHRLNFVAELVVPFANLVKGKLDWGDRTISWDDVAARWNQAHPDEKMSAKALERVFRRDRSDQRLRELYFDGEFRDWAKQAERLRHTLSWLESAGLRPEDVFVKTVAHHNPRLADDVHWMLSEAQVLRRANEVEGIDPATRKQNEARAEVFEASAQTLTRASEVKEWSVISAKLSPSLGRAFERAVRRNCGLTADRVAYPRDERFCEGPHCRKCKVGAELVKAGFARQEDLVELTAAGAGKRHRRRLDESAQNWRKLFEFANRRSRG